jgi:hypothetical protein
MLKENKLTPIYCFFFIKCLIGVFQLCFFFRSDVAKLDFCYELNFVHQFIRYFNERLMAVTVMVSNDSSVGTR